ncbi:MAG: sulfatase-like hydrolase/transferase, partial [Anaerolineae bacterium]|nr:sulfatase-like hydrolase/transferase [Anaerolineae bacterium]
LDATGQRENTLIVFTSDHGDFAWEYGMVKKDLVHQDCLLHVPCLISLPKRIAPAVVDHTMVEEVDLMPTLLELCGIDVPYGCQGRSFVHLLDGSNKPHKDAVFAEVERPEARLDFETLEEYLPAFERSRSDPARYGFERLSINVPGDFCKSIRTERYRYVWYAAGYEELYDLHADPHAWHSRAEDPALANTKAELRDRLLTWLALTEDPVDPAAADHNLQLYGDWQS